MTANLDGVAVPIAGIAGDQQAALFGQACVTPGMAKNTYGTGCFLLMHTGGAFQPSHNGLLVTSAAQTSAQAQYAMEGSVFVGGAVVQWLRDGLKAIPGSAHVQALAESVPDAGGVMMVPAFTGLGAPYWNAEARGKFLRVPIMPNGADLYTRQVTYTALRGDVPATLRLSLLPYLASAAAVAFRITGSDKGIW